MATLAFIRGWINVTFNQTNEIRTLVARFIDDEGDNLGDERFRALLKQCWHYPEETGPGSDFVLIGASVKANLLPLFESQLRAIASEVVDDDNGVKYTLSGRIEITVEGQLEDQQWIISDGMLDTTRRLPYLLSP